MTISVGDKLPDATFITKGPDGLRKITTGELCSGKRVVLFAVPGAFTSTCTNTHVPGYIDEFDTIVKKGVDTIAVVSVNDVSVMAAWAKSTGAERILHLADGNAEFTKAVGLDQDRSDAGMGIRSVRYSMIIDDGVVTALNIEDAIGQVTSSGAARILEQL